MAVPVMIIDMLLLDDWRDLDIEGFDSALCRIE